MLLERLERFARRTPAVVRLYNSPWFAAVYNRLLFPLTIPLPQWSEPGKVGLILKAKPFTLLSWARLSALYDAAKSLDGAELPGAIVECGVWKGGSAAVLARAAASRQLWLFDSWEGFPEPTGEDVSVTESHGAARGMFAASEDDVRRALARVGADADRPRLVRGWFDRTLLARRDEVGPIALLHMDADLYESSKTILEALYDRLSPGGWLFVDDYGNWRGCRKAVDEFFAARGLSPQWRRVDFTGVCWRKPR